MKKQILSEEFKRMQKLAGIQLNENEEFSNDFPTLDYNDVVNFINDKGYKVTSEYYDGGFDVNDGEYFVGIFDDHIAVLDNEGVTKNISFS
jgi:hypothetical protein